MKHFILFLIVVLTFSACSHNDSDSPDLLGQLYVNNRSYNLSDLYWHKEYYLDPNNEKADYVIRFSSKKEMELMFPDNLDWIYFILSTEGLKTPVPVGTFPYEGNSGMFKTAIVNVSSTDDHSGKQYEITEGTLSITQSSGFHRFEFSGHSGDEKIAWSLELPSDHNLFKSCGCL